jgi:pimeloyl-ACP methyl ester carboxylesterase
MPEGGAWNAAYRLIRTAARLVALLVAVVLTGAALYEHIGAWRDSRVLKQIGRSVDIGGRTLNIHCTGEGSPTVILASARTAPGYVWTPTQHGVSAFTRACWYDRADLGWSHSGPDPGWGDAAARDLHQLVENAGLKRPLVLVGHSFGGYIIRLYHHAYPGEVSGMVFADAALEGAGTIDGMPHRERPPIPRSVIRGLSIVLGRLGMMRFLASDPGPPPKYWSAAEWDILARLRRQRNVLLADAKVGPGHATDDLVRSAGGLENMPLIVLTQGNQSSPSSASPGVLRGWMDLQRRFAERSRRGRQVVVPDSGHGMPVEAPDAIIRAVREIVATVRHEQLLDQFNQALSTAETDIASTTALGTHGTVDLFGPGGSPTCGVGAFSANGRFYDFGTVVFDRPRLGEEDDGSREWPE